MQILSGNFLKIKNFPIWKLTILKMRIFHANFCKRKILFEMRILFGDCGLKLKMRIFQINTNFIL